MTGTSVIEIKWNAIGKSLMRLCLAFGAGFFVLALLNRIPEFKLLVQKIDMDTQVYRRLSGICSRYGHDLADFSR